jgi:Tol biopolymer transport system component
MARRCGLERIRRDPGSALGTDGKIQEAHFIQTCFVSRGRMRLATGARLGPYEVTGVLGAGGMGEVYRARDNKLGRDVAIKILPETLARDPTALALLEREARAVASFSHPNILAIYEFGQTDTIAYAVMELLEGQTLREQLGGGALPLRECVDFAVQIAGALATAHSKGIVHRDLKPGNVFITVDGHVKLLDFGLCVQRSPGPISLDETTPPRLTSDSGLETVMGTVSYMSPEQVRGGTMDHRTDLFAFGVVLYEMLTGQHPFARETAAETMTAILKEDAPELPPALVETTPGLGRIVEHCLEKNPEERFQSARDIAFNLKAVMGDSSRWRTADVNIIRGPAALRLRVRERVAWAACALIALAAFIVAYRYARDASQFQQKVLSEIVSPEGTTIGGLAVSPDGQRLAFIGWKNGASQLWVRSLDTLVAQPLAGSEGASYPFWSPDSLQLGFFADGKLKKISASGGSVQVLADAPNGGGGTWNEENVIVFVPTFDMPLWRVSAGGGPSQPVTQIDASRREIAHRRPYFLPGGQRFLYAATSLMPENNGVYAGSLDGKTRELLVPDANGAVYAAPGYLIFPSGKSLVALPFRAPSLKVEGHALTLVDQIGGNELGGTHYSAAMSGRVLVYQRGSPSLGTDLRWFSRSGQPLATVGTSEHYWSLRMSPEGRSVAVETQDQRSWENRIWIYDLARNVPRRITFSQTEDVSPVWSPDGQFIAFASRNQGQHYSMYLKPSSGGGQEQLLLQMEGDIIPQDWSRDGRRLLFTAVNPTVKQGGSLWVLPMQGERKPFLLFQSPNDDDYPRFSPNALWVAYRSNESGRKEIYVIPSQGSGGKWQVSSGGGDWPVWRPDGKELFYISPASEVMSAAVREATSTFQFDSPRPLFQTRVLGGLGERYNVTADGQRFLILLPKEESPSPLTLILNWATNLNQ